MNKKVKFTIFLLTLMIAFVISFVLWKNSLNKQNLPNEDLYKCERGNGYKVAITISPGNVKITEDINQATYKEVTNVMISNKSSCPQLIKITPPKPLIIKEKQIRLEANNIISLPLSIDIPPNYKEGVYDKSIIFETITPKEDQKIVLKNNYHFKVVKSNGLNMIYYYFSKYKVYFISLLVLLLIVIGYIVYKRKKPWL